MSRLKTDKLVSVHEQQRLEREADKLTREGRMPELPDLLSVIGENSPEISSDDLSDSQRRQASQ